MTRKKTDRITVHWKIARDLHKRIKQAAKDDNRTVTGWLVVAALDRLNKEGK